jgi:DNA-directed RNA polymerase subunit beta'
LKTHGISDTEDLYDPVTKRKFPNVLTGPQYILKLHHTAEKGLSTRSRDAYDSNMLPSSGGPKGGQTMDAMGLYALLAHNARENIREIQTYKCFLRRTTVETDHGPMLISTIVNRKMPVRVLSWNRESGQLEYRSILNYWKRRIDTPLVKVEFMARNSRGEFDLSVTKCTEGHEFYTSSEPGNVVDEAKTEAKNLAGKYVVTPGLVPDNVQLDVLFGSLLGDGHLSKRHHHFPAYQERHCEAQLDYLEFKADVLRDFSNRDVRGYNAGFDGFNNGQQMCEWGTLAQPSFTDLYRDFYKDGKKKVPESVTSSLSPLAVAIWYQDDGSLTHGNGQRTIRLHTGAFDEEDRRRLISGLQDRVGVTFTELRNNESWDLRLGKKEDVDRFLDYVAPYIHPSMAYKADNRAVGEALDELLETVGALEGLVAVPVVRVSTYNDLTFNDGHYLYNLEVEGNHNYFANRTLVGNSDMNDDFWVQLQAGDAIPSPKTPFVFKKFEGYLKGMGLDTRKEGNNLILQPLTDKKVLEMSNGALADAGRALRAKDAKEEDGGIFDLKITGGIKGKKWSHISLSDRMPNPVFEDPISALLGINQNKFKRVVNGEEELGGKTGPSAIIDALKEIEPKSLKKDVEKAIPTLRTNKLNTANKTLKYLRALERADMTPTEAYTMKHLPVLPPAFRPLTILDSGDLLWDDVNRLYNRLGQVNAKLKEIDPASLPEDKVALQAALYDGLKAVTLTGAVHQGRHRNAIMQTITGSTEGGGQPKEGFFQDKIIGRRQDLSMRGVIIPEPSLSLDEVGLPRKAAAELYKPFVVRHLVQMGHKPLDAQDMVKKNHPAALSALQAVVDERPILLKRDPVLHKFGVQAFRPKLIEGKAIKIHPLATTGYNADFDGDKMSAFVPVSAKAVKEAYKMMPSFNLFNPATGYLMAKPKHETMMGLYKLTEMDKKSGFKFPTAAEAARAVKDGKLGLTDLVSLDSLEGDPFLELMTKKSAQPIHTTVGRVMLYQSLPEEIRDQRLLTDPKYLLDKNNLHNLLTDVATRTPKDFGSVSDRFKDIGNEFATGMSISLNDFVSDHEHRDEVLRDASKKEVAIRNRTSSPVKRKDAIVKLYVDAAEKIHAVAKKNADVRNSRMYDWVRSGARGSWDQFKQMTVAPMLVADSKGDPVPIPIPKSYSEGLDIGSYFASMHGARMGTIGRVQGTQAPGKMSKQLINTTMNQLVVSEDCGASKGVVLSTDQRDVLDRYTVRDIDLGVKAGLEKGKIKAGTLVTPDVLSRLKNNKIDKVEVRSPIKCSHGMGICAKCYGLNEDGKLHSLGTNLGVMAAQALGEPATQLAMNAFHTGGIVGAKGTDASGLFRRLEQLLSVPKKLPGAATLSDVDGKVTSIDKDPAGGWRVHIGSGKDAVAHYVPASRAITVKKGVEVKRGDAITDGPKNPREMLSRTNMNAVQQYLTEEIWNAYKDEGPVKRRNVETFVRAMTNLSKVSDPGDHDTLLKGDHASTSEIVAFNRALKPGHRPVHHEPVLQGINMLPLEMQTDWIARLQSRELKNTLLDAAAEGWKSALHSTHPIPAMAYGKSFGEGTPEEPWLY